MGNRSVKEDKNIYFTSREEAGLTREAAAEQMGCISADRIYKIETEKAIPHPDEVLLMAECYKNPSLCNYFCSHECEIGQKYVPEVKVKDLPHITLEMLATLNRLQNNKDRLIEISADGELSEDELPDFLSIQNSLNEMSLAIDALKLWVNNAVATGKLDSSMLR
ncbi:MAG: helix-turn-helix transcriptional regulator [Lachnospiraceae bacterium]|nr:helix-turn-helix transcriptional regulator [Lachnospiraceae bacterium]